MDSDLSASLCKTSDNNVSVTSTKKFKLYCHTNLLNGKKYIGITCQELNQRFRNGKGYKSSPHFNAAIEKYGWENFSHEVILSDLTEAEAKELEIEYIAKYETRNPDFGYNIARGGETASGPDNPWFGKHHTEENKRLFSKLHKGVPKSEETKRKIGLAHKGKVVSEETRRKMRENHYDCSGANNPNYGKKLSKEHIEMLVAASKTPEAIAKMKKNKIWYSGAENPHAKSVVCLDTGKVYSTIKEAAEDTGCRPEKISSVCHGARKHTKQLHFKLLEDDNE